MLIFKTYFIGIFCLILISALGRMCMPLHHVKLKSPAVNFLQFTLVLMAVVFIFSVWATHGVTVNVILGVFLLTYFLANRKRGYSLDFNLTLAPFGIPLIMFTFFFLVKCFAFYNFSYQAPNIPHNDILYYTTISDFIGETGQENLSNFRNVINSSFNGLNPYHYFEMWVSALLSRIFGVNSLAVFELLTHSLLLTVTALGFYGLITQLSERGNKYLIFFLSIGLVFYSGLSINYPKIGIIPYNGAILPKLLPIYFFCLMFTVFFLAGEFWTAVAVLIVLAWINTAAAPGIYIGLFLFACLKFFLEKDKKVAAKIITWISFSVLGYALLFMLFKSGNSHLESGIISRNTLLGAGKTWTLQSLLLFTNYCIILIPFLWLLKDRISLNTFAHDHVLQAVLILVFIIIGGVFFSGILNTVVSSQFAYNLYIPVMSIMTIFVGVLLSRIDASNVLFYFVGVISFVVIMDAYFTFESPFFSKTQRIERYSVNYIRESTEILQKCSGNLGIFIAEPAFFEGSDLSKSEDYHYPGKYLKAYRSKLYLANYMPDKIKSQNSILGKSYRNGNALIQYASTRNSAMNMDAARMLFVREFKPGFLVVQGEQGPPAELRKFVRDSAIDNRSHEKFYRLEYDSPQ